MDMGVFAAFRAETDPTRRRRLADKLVRDNMALVNKLVMQLSRRGNHQGWEGNKGTTKNGTVGDLENRRQPIDPADLLQAGRIGFMRALEKYDPEKGGIAIYAKHWIRHELQQCMIHEKTIYTPRGTELPYGVHQKAAAVMAKEGREATPEELGITQAQYDAWKEVPGIVMSLDESLDDEGHRYHDGGQNYDVDGGLGVGERYQADDRPDAENRLAEAEACQFSVEMLDAVLTPMEKVIIKETFYRDKKPAMIAKQVGVSIELVERTLKNALAKLREELDDAEG